MTEEEAAALNTYASTLGLGRASVCILLVHREIRKKALVLLRKTLAPYPGVKEGVRVTAHVRDPALKAEFAVHVKALGLGADEAASLLFRGELKNHHLFNELAWNGNHG